MLRQTAAILFLLVHLFNIGGYRFLFDKFEQQASHTLVAQLDNEQYSDDQLIEMKVPLSLPYTTNSSSFERFNGEILIDGVHYNYVKRKVWNDTLIVLCIPNHQKMKLNSAKDQFFSLVNDLDQKSEKTPISKHGISKSITSDFQIQENQFDITLIAIARKKSVIQEDDQYVYDHVVSDEQPPEIV